MSFCRENKTTASDMAQLLQDKAKHSDFVCHDFSEYAVLADSVSGFEYTVEKTEGFFVVDGTLHSDLPSVVQWIAKEHNAERLWVPC